MQRRLCEMSEAKWSITEAKCLQRQHNKYASQRDAISYSMGNLMLSHSAGMHNTDKSIAGISKRFHFASLYYIFSAYLPTHIKSLRDFLQSHWKHAEGMSLPFVCNLNGENPCVLLICYLADVSQGCEKKRGCLLGEPRCVMWSVVWALYLKK